MDEKKGDVEDVAVASAAVPVEIQGVFPSKDALYAALRIRAANDVAGVRPDPSANNKKRVIYKCSVSDGCSVILFPFLPFAASSLTRARG